MELHHFPFVLPNTEIDIGLIYSKSFYAQHIVHRNRTHEQEIQKNHSLTMLLIVVLSALTELTRVWQTIPKQKMQPNRWYEFVANFPGPRQISQLADIVEMMMFFERAHSLKCLRIRDKHGSLAHTCMHTLSLANVSWFIERARSHIYTRISHISIYTHRANENPSGQQLMTLFSMNDMTYRRLL